MVKNYRKLRHLLYIPQQKAITENLLQITARRLFQITSKVYYKLR